MSQTTSRSIPAVSPEEAQRWIAEYRRLGFEHQAPAHVVYHPPHQLCPWHGCGYRIAAIGFRLDGLGDPAHIGQWLEAWWQGPGLVGPCPGCGQLVLFGMSEKQMVAERAGLKVPVLPDDWYLKAALVPPLTPGVTNEHQR